MKSRRYILCTIDDCLNEHKAHGYCAKHYMRLRKHGDANKTLYPNHGKFEHCTALGCNKKIHASLRCKKHYRRFKEKLKKDGLVENKE